MWLKLSKVWGTLGEEICFIVAGDIKSSYKRSIRVKWYHTVRVAKEVWSTRELPTYFAYFVRVLMDTGH